jgi:hypothetical protein
MRVLFRELIPLFCKKVTEQSGSIDTPPPAPFREQAAVDEYVTNYRRSDLPPLEVSGLLDLLPDQSLGHDLRPELTWRDPWPFGSRAGAYLVYDHSVNLIYVGKAAVIGNRLAAYFGGGPECVFRQGWGIPPRFLRVIAVPPDMHFEAAGLEAFLIARLHPHLNTQGKYKMPNKSRMDNPLPRPESEIEP